MNTEKLFITRIFHCILKNINILQKYNTQTHILNKILKFPNQIQLKNYQLNILLYHAFSRTTYTETEEHIF